MRTLDVIDITRVGLVTKHFSEDGKPVFYDKLLYYISSLKRKAPDLFGDEIKMPDGIEVATVYSTGKASSAALRRIKAEFVTKSAWTGPRIESSSSEGLLFIVKARSDVMAELKKRCEECLNIPVVRKKGEPPAGAWEHVLVCRMVTDVMRCKSCGKYVFKSHPKMKYCSDSCRRHAEKLRRAKKS